ncbi:hypothetical protein GGR57DRAFT_26135 [Xylariaceae sp. FL1272]|nr:hypothetical protein GGR57DRAFT_26135 [Xylariaceae sp. FL1272]
MVQRPQWKRKLLKTCNLQAPRMLAQGLAIMTTFLDADTSFGLVQASILTQARQTSDRPLGIRSGVDISVTQTSQTGLSCLNSVKEAAKPKRTGPPLRYPFGTDRNIGTRVCDMLKQCPQTFYPGLHPNSHFRQIIVRIRASAKMQLDFRLSVIE